MSTKHTTGISSTRPTREASSSHFPPGTPLARRIAPYTMSPPRALRSRCVVRGSFGTVATLGDTTGLPLPSYAARGEWEWRNIAEMNGWHW